MTKTKKPERNQTKENGMSKYIAAQRMIFDGAALSRNASTEERAMSLASFAKTTGTTGELLLLEQVDGDLYRVTCRILARESVETVALPIGE